MKKLIALTPLLFLLMNSTFAQLQIDWQQCYGGSEYEEAVDILPAFRENQPVPMETSDGDFVIFANTHSFDGDVVDNPPNSTTRSSIWAFGLTDITVGITDAHTFSVVVIYPNPAHSELTIQLPGEMLSENTTIELFNLNGMLMMKSKPVSVLSRFEINYLNSGLYLVKIQNNDHLILKKLIIR